MDVIYLNALMNKFVFQRHLHFEIYFLYVFCLHHSTDILPGGFVSYIALSQHVHNIPDLAQENARGFEAPVQITCNCLPSIL